MCQPKKINYLLLLNWFYYMWLYCTWLYKLAAWKVELVFLFSSNWIIISCYFLNVAVATHYSILQLNLHYPDLAYLDFLIIDFGLASLVPVFHKYWCSSRILCSQQNFLASNYVRKLHCKLNLSPLQNTNLKEFCAH